MDNNQYVKNELLKINKSNILMFYSYVLNKANRRTINRLISISVNNPNTTTNATINGKKEQIYISKKKSDSKKYNLIGFTII